MREECAVQSRFKFCKARRLLRASHAVEQEEDASQTHACAKMHLAVADYFGSQE